MKNKKIAYFPEIMVMKMVNKYRQTTIVVNKKEYTYENSKCSRQGP